MEEPEGSHCSSRISFCVRKLMNEQSSASGIHTHFERRIKRDCKAGEGRDMFIQNSEIRRSPVM